MKLLTVTIPAYNMEKLLPCCLNSLTAAGCADELEAIIVNDGSMDGTLAVARDYEKRYPGMIRVIDKENGGHGSGINAGIKAATGRYFKVLDADDWFDSDALKKLLAILRDCSAELVTTGFCCVDADSLRVTEQRSPVLGGPMDEGLYDFDEVCGNMFARMHSVTFRTDILKDNNIRIDEHKFYVDMEYILLPVPYIKKVYVSEFPLYMYRLGANGQSVSLASMRKNIDHHLSVMQRVLTFIDECRLTGLCGEKLDYLERGAAEMATNQCLIYLSFPRRDNMKTRLVETERMLEERYPNVYGSVRNPAVLALRKSGYLLFGAARLAVKLTRK